MKTEISVAVAIVLFAASLAVAGTGPAGVKNTPHNLSSSQLDFALNGVVSSNETQICIFCHTPHGGTLDAPLWNRNAPSATGFTHYSSATLASFGISSSRPVRNESLACLSCHDGSIGVGDIINDSGVVPERKNTSMRIGFDGGPGPRIGASRANLPELGNELTTGIGDLSDDHPISVSYKTVSETDTAGYKPISDVEGKGLALFGGADKNVECATCHDPHVDYITNTAWTPFLAIPNDGSDLCLSCHIK